MRPVQQIPRTALRAAQAAFVIGMASAAVSVYWGLGGTWLLDTVGGTLVSQGQAAAAAVLAAVWGAAVLKAAAAALPLLYCRVPAALTGPAARRRGLARVLIWLEAAILTLYGGVLVAVGLLVQSGLITRPAGADEKALAWHAYLWDPWFLVWGLLVLAVLARTSPRRLASAPSAGS